MSAPHLWVACYTVAGIAVLAAAAGLIVLRLLARRSLAAILAVIAAVTVVATLASVVAVARAMFISAADFHVVVCLVVITGVAGLAVAMLVGRRVCTVTGLLLEAVRSAGCSGDYHEPPMILPAELASLSREIGTTHQRLAGARARERALEGSRRELVAWVSHDLRAPLAGLQAMAEALEDRVAGDPVTVVRYHAQIRKETDRLNRMVDDLFELSRIHAGALRLSLRLVGMTDLIGDALNSIEPLARSKGVQLRGCAPVALPVLADSAQLSRAIGNVVTNAIRHTPPGGSVEVTTTAEADTAVLTVSDSCGGIPAEHLSRVFEVAFRGESARTPGAVGGAGLGLSIARGIVEAHAGEIAARNTGPGCQFIIRLPLTDTEAVAGQGPGVG